MLLQTPQYVAVLAHVRDALGSTSSLLQLQQPVYALHMLIMELADCRRGSNLPESCIQAVRSHTEPVEEAWNAATFCFGSNFWIKWNQQMEEKWWMILSGGADWTAAWWRSWVWTSTGWTVPRRFEPEAGIDFFCPPTWRGQQRGNYSSGQRRWCTLKRTSTVQLLLFLSSEMFIKVFCLANSV